MIKFFRKIRQKLLVENRFNKYLLYAIGEIILVVIGILIALQINTWNEQNKNNQFEVKILKEISASIQLDLIRNKAILEERILPKKKAIESLIKDMHSEEKVHDSILRKNFRKAGLGVILTYDKGAYESLKAIGFDKINNDSLRNKLIRFYENILPRSKERLRGFRDNVDQRTKLRDKLLESKYVKKKIWIVSTQLNTKDLKTNKYLLKLLDLEGDIYWNNKRIIESIINESEAIIKYIEQTLNNYD